jgi:hypothetical protein
VIAEPPFDAGGMAGKYLGQPLVWLPVPNGNWRRPFKHVRTPPSPTPPASDCTERISEVKGLERAGTITPEQTQSRVKQILEECT